MNQLSKQLLRRSNAGSQFRTAVDAAVSILFGGLWRARALGAFIPIGLIG